MSSYALSQQHQPQQQEQPYQYSPYDRLYQYHHKQFQGPQGQNFSVSHLLDLEELPRDCAMYASNNNNDQEHLQHHNQLHPGQNQHLQSPPPPSCLRSSAPDSPDSHKLSGERN
jgi:hypothetical protein